MDKNQAIVDFLNTTKYQRKTEQGIYIYTHTQIYMQTYEK